MKLSIKEMTLTSLFAALTVVGSYIFIPLPFSPVPITLQLLFAFLSGGILGKRLGLLSQVLYLFMGAIGLPVFAAGTGGIGIFFGPTGGYLLGFLPAAYLAGIGKNKFNTKLLYLLLALFFLYLSGITGLIIFGGLNINSALKTGILPFLPGDLFKVFLASYIISKFPKNNLL